MSGRQAGDKKDLWEGYFRQAGEQMTRVMGKEQESPLIILSDYCQDLGNGWGRSLSRMK